MIKRRTPILGLVIIAIVATLSARVIVRSFSPTHSNLLSSNPRSPSSLAQLPPLVDSPADPNDHCQNIYRLVCHKRGESNDPTGTVRPDVAGERQALQMFEEIIRNHRNWTLEQVDQELVSQIFDPKRRGRIESAFKWVRHAIERFINQQPETVFTPQEKRQIRDRVRKVVLQLPPPASIYADEPDLLTKNEVYYERLLNGEMRLRVGGAFVFVAKSWFNLVFTLAHEVAHAIDPCEIKSARLSFPAYDHLTACLLEQGLIAIRKTRSECGEDDQLSETFADWMAVQITADALTHFATEFHGPQVISAARNSVRDLCIQEEDPSEIDVHFHPSPQVRIEKIFGYHPVIRDLLGCSASQSARPYCTFTGESL